jgi:hypothetical protein
MQELKGKWTCRFNDVDWFYTFTSDSEFSGKFTTNNLDMNIAKGNYTVKVSGDEIEFKVIGGNTKKEKYIVKYRLDGKRLTMHVNSPMPMTLIKGCYVATCVYGSYDCPEVWTLRRYRDNKLANSWFGRRFISIYYSISPDFVRLFGKRKWFHKILKPCIDTMVVKLRKKGIDDSPYSE